MIRDFRRLDEGSEHIVYFDQDDGRVIKCTRLGIYGESYYLDPLNNNRMTQRNCSPLEYLIRLRLWKKLFGSAPTDLGITKQGQIVSSQKFIVGERPTQDAVDQFLFQSGLTAVKQQFWLWRKSYPDFDIWIGDARTDNFVATENGLVPIDIRVWFDGVSW